MDLITQIHLNKFKRRPYQQGLWDAVMKEGKKKALVIWPRRAGKDLTIWDIVINLALRRTTITYYIFPTYSQARKALFDSMTNDGKKFLDYIPPECIVRKNEQEMKITLYNNSIIQFVGSTDYDKLMGTNPSVCVFSEYALQDPRAYQYIRPILTANNGLALFCSTVRGKNHLFDLYNIAKDNESWYCSKLSVDDTRHVDIEEIDRLVLEGEMSFDMARQEFWNDFNLGVEGSYYSRYLDKMELDGRLGKVPWENDFKVHTSWDLGMSDSMTIIWFQTIGTAVHIIDTYSNSDRGLEHYIEVLNSKPWHKHYGVHIAPHDIKVRELGTGLSRLEKASQLGVDFTIAPNISIIDGIEGVRSTLGRVYINVDTCKSLIEALSNYRKVFNEKNGVYDTRPLHDKFSHFADNLRYLCLSLPKTRDGMTPDDLDRIRQEALYGESSYNRGPFAQRSIRKY